MQQPTQETSAQPEQDDFDIHVKTMDVGQYNTINLQAEPAAGLREVLGEEPKGDTAKATSDSITRSIVAPMMDSDTESLDYPEIAEKVCKEIVNGSAEKGILLCGTGIGISMAANKIKGIRAALCSDVFSARMSREHNNANVLAMGGRVVGPGPASEIVRAWMTTEFSHGERHQRRIDKMMALENK